MSKEGFFERIDARDFKPNEKYEEVIDGFIVVHTGRTDKKEEYDRDGNYVTRSKEEIVVYDGQRHRFYSNYDSKERAKEAVERLKNSGIEAIIGPSAPIRDNNGDFMKVKNPAYVGVYIVKQKEEVETEKEKEQVK